MVQIYNCLIESTFSSSIFIIILILIRKTFDGRVNGDFNVFLWLVLAFDLVLPPIPRKVFLFPRFFINGSQLESIDKNMSYGNSHLEFFMSNDINTMLMASTGNSSIDMSLCFQTAIVSLWLVGVVTISILIMRRHMEVKGLILSSIVDIDKDSFDIEDIEMRTGVKSSRIRYCWSSYVTNPMIYGIINPIVIIPNNINKFMSIEEIKFIIFHEVYHYRRKDILVLLIADILKVVFWFNPLVWMAFNMMRNDIEVACDMNVVNKIGFSNRKAYGMTIIKMIENHSKTSKLSLGLGFLNYKSQVMRRIKMMNFDKKKQNKYIVPFVLVIIFSSFVFMTSADDGVDSVSKSKSIENTVVNSIVNEENPEKNDFKVIWPLPGYSIISSGYGGSFHPVLKKESIHTGIDIPAPYESEIIAAYDGKVVLSEKLEGYGNTVILDHGNGYKTMYAHCESLSVVKDQNVKSSEVIAKVGSTGKSTGPHLHFEIRKNDEHVNPQEYIVDESN